MSRRRSVLAGVIFAAVACAPHTTPAQTSPVGAGSASDSTAGLPPAGFGQLNQDAITLKLRSQSLEIRFTPLDERVTRLLANDAYQSLRLLQARNQAAIDSIAQRQGIRHPGVVLVSFFALAPNTPFDPNLLLLDSRNRLVRPAGFLALSASFGAQRLDTRAQAMGLVLYEDAIPVNEPFTLRYLDSTTDDWEQRLTRFDRERARIQGRTASDTTRGQP